MHIANIANNKVYALLSCSEMKCMFVKKAVFNFSLYYCSKFLPYLITKKFMNFVMWYCTGLIVHMFHTK